MRNIRLILKFKASQAASQTIVIHTLSNIPKCKGNHQIMKKSKRNIFIRLAFQTSFCLLQKFYVRQKQLVYSLVSIYFDSYELELQ